MNGPNLAKVGAKPGSRPRKPRSDGITVYASRPPSRVEVALSGSTVDADPAVTPDEWGKLRERTWERWQRLVGELPDDGLAGRQMVAREKAIERGVRLTPSQERRLEPAPRDSRRDWPPIAASFDGITTRGLASYGAPAVVTKLAADGLAEVEAFKKSDPEAARSIAASLREYVRRLRAVRDNPELRAYGSRPS